MTRSIEFFFDVGSPASYLAWTQRHTLGAPVTLRPMLLGGVFKATGNASPVSVPAKGRWMMADLQRWAVRHGVPFRMNPHFPINTLTLMRGATAMQRQGEAVLDRYLSLVFPAMWAEPRNLGDAAVLAALLAEGGFDGEAFLAAVSDAEVKAALVATTEEAVARGVFGAPTFFVGDEMHFGQDRLDFVREAAARG